MYVDSRTDLWSLGGVLYRALTGQGIHASSSDLVELAMAICTKAPTAVQELAPWIPPEVAAIVDGALQIDAKDRFENAAAMFEAIRPLLVDGFGLSEEMLVSLGEAERLVIAPKFEKPASKALRALTTLDTVAPTPSEPVVISGISDEVPTKVDVPLRPRPLVAAGKAPRTALAFVMVGGIAALGGGAALLSQRTPNVQLSPVASASASTSPPDVENAAVERSAAQARNAERMAAASAHQNDPTTVLALLREIEPGPALPRGWEENTRAAGYAGVAHVVLPHDGAVFSAAYSPDGKHIVSASGDRMVRVWNADGIGEALVLRGHDDGVGTVAYSPDGQRIVSASLDKTMRVWNADGTGKPLVLRGNNDGVVWAAWSPDGKGGCMQRFFAGFSHAALRDTRQYAPRNHPADRITDRFQPAHW